MSHEFVAKNGIISQGNIVISGSITTTGGITVSGSIASASYSLSSSYASSSTSASYAVSSSYALSSSYSLSSSYAANATSASYALSSSYAYNSTLHNGTASAVFATTGSNNLVGDQHITSTTIANAFTSTASLYTDGGLQVTKDAYFSSSMFIKGNLTIYGTQSIAYITSSQLNIATNLITVNTATPAVRFGGLAVYDSGSTGTGMTGSLLWDSQNNSWIYDNPSGSGNYDSAMVIMGPRNASALGSEQGLSCNYLVLGHGSHHTTSSMIFHDGSTTCLPGTLNVNPGSVLSRINLGYNFCIENDQSPEITSFINSSGTSIFRWMQGTSPVEKMRLSNVGYLGIGTSSPTTALYVSGSGDTTITINVSGANNPRLKFSGGSGVINRGSTSDAIYLGETADTGNYFFRGSGVVGINASAATTDDGNLVVAGAVGTGQGATNTVAQINIWETTSANKAGLWFGSMTNANTGVIGSRTATGNIAFQTYCGGWAERMRITYNGNVGIATTSPSSFLHLGTYASSGKYIDSAALPTAPSNYLITLSPPSTTNYYGGGIAWSEGTCVAAAINAYDDGAGGALGLSISTGNNTTLTERIRITSTGIACFACQLCAPVAIFAGCVGMGSTSPQHKLDIQNGNLGIYNNTNVGGGNGGAQLYLGDMNFAGGAYACSAPGIGAVCSPSAAGVAGDLAFFTYTGIVACRTERMRIAGGNVGIGVTAPFAKLHVAGTIYSNVRCNTIDTDDGISNNFQGYGGYWALRTDESNRFNLDVYNSGTPITALQLSLAGAACFSSTIQASGATIASDVVGDPVYLRVRNNNTGGYPSSLALSLYGYSGTAAYFDPIRIQASYPGYGSANFFVKYQSTSSDVLALTLRGDGMVYLPQVYGNSMGAARTTYIQSDGQLGGVTSSIRASKKNIENLSNVNWIYELNPVSFNYRKKDEEGNYTEDIYEDIIYGLIAEDTQPLADFLINYNDKKDGTKEMLGIEYMRLITPMLKAIQEQQCTICTQASMINTLKTCLGII